jgi:hypothetical protein
MHKRRDLEPTPKKPAGRRPTRRRAGSSPRSRRWRDPDLTPGRQADRVQAWSDESKIWVSKAKISLLKRFSERPVHFSIGAALVFLLVGVVLIVLTVTTTWLCSTVGIETNGLLTPVLGLVTASGVGLSVHRRRHQPATPIHGRTPYS